MKKIMPIIEIVVMINTLRYCEYYQITSYVYVYFLHALLPTWRNNVETNNNYSKIYI